MNATHIGSLPTGKRLHLTHDNGFSECGRHCIDLAPIEDMNALAAEGLCATCLTRIAEAEIVAARIGADARQRRVNEATRAPQIVDALEVAVHALKIAVVALTEIADLDDFGARSVAVEAGLKIKVAMGWEA